MANAKWTKEALEGNTVSALREMCKDLQIPGMSKKRKDVIIAAIVAKKSRTRSTAVAVETTDPDSITGVECSVKSIMNKPGASYGRITSTVTVSVSCGASSGKYPVVGKKLGAVAEFLREVLNIPSTPKMLVNGKEANASYIIEETDVIEFMKPSGRKGIGAGI